MGDKLESFKDLRIKNYTFQRTQKVSINDYEDDLEVRMPREPPPELPPPKKRKYSDAH